MKVLWVSEFHIPSGFARVSKALVKHLQKKLDITVLDWYSEKDVFASGVKVLSKKSKTDSWAISRFVEVCSEYDAVFILNDVWNIAKYLSAIKNNPHIGKIPKIVAYFPVDAKLHNAEWYKDFDIVHAAVTYTKYAETVVRDCMPAVDFPIHVIPHGIDTDVFFKSMTDKAEIRNHTYRTNQLKDAFVFINTNRNAPRKKLDITVQAFSQFLINTKSKNAYLHLHCGLTDRSLDIAELVKRFKVDSRIIITGITDGMQNVDSDVLNLYYNSADVGLNSSVGEGWGLCSCESAIAGAAQIVPNHSACKEIFEGKALLIDSPLEIVFPETSTLGNIPDYRHMALCMQKYYEDEKLRQEHSNLLIDYFSQPKFNWANISNEFYKLFI